MNELELLHAEFLSETTPLVAAAERTILALEARAREGTPRGELWTDLLRLLHTIKGNCAMLGHVAAQELVHAMEGAATAARDAGGDDEAEALTKLLACVDTLGAALPAPEAAEAELAAARGRLEPAGNGPRERRAEATDDAKTYTDKRITEVRIASEKLDRLLELVGELSIHHSRVVDLVRRMADKLPSSDPATALAGEIVDPLTKTIEEVRAHVRQARLLPISMVFGRFERLVRDTCVATGKVAKLELVGGDTVVDKTIVDALGEPLVHILRNAIDHGIEAPAERRAAGKPASGRIEISAAHRSGDLLVSVTDDGRGIPRARLRERAAAHGIDTIGWSDTDILELIFLPELSTATRVTELSGRGVGLDAARRAIERIGGRIDVESDDAGTRFHLHAPLTLTIKRCLVVECAGETFAIPLASVLASERMAKGAVHALDGAPVFRWRGKIIPLYDLAKRLGVPGASARDRGGSLCLIVEDAARCRGLLVDGVVGEQELVVKDLDPALGRVPALSGAAILGDGRVIMVVDTRGIAARGAAGSTARAAREERA